VHDFRGKYSCARSQILHQTHTRRHTMLNFILNKIASIVDLFGQTYQTNLEKFIESKQPTDISQVEYWARVYFRNHEGFWL